MQGTRLFETKDDDEDFIWKIAKTPGSYGTINGRDWFCSTPNGLLGNLSAHEVVEHEDQTITVSPSILVTRGSRHGDPSWHGYLKHGIWSEC